MSDDALEGSDLGGSVTFDFEGNLRDVDIYAGGQGPFHWEPGESHQDDRDPGWMPNLDPGDVVITDPLSGQPLHLHTNPDGTIAPPPPPPAEPSMSEPGDYPLPEDDGTEYA